MELPARQLILGVGVHPVNYVQATEAVLAAARERRAFAATALAVHGVMTGVDDDAQRVRLNRLDLVTPDGQPVRWALNWLHHAALADRVYGPFLMLRICERAATEKLRVFLYGSDASMLDALREGLARRFPGLRITGTRPSRFRRATETEWAEDVAAIQEAQPDIVFCGLGCPRQETWVYEMRSHLSCPLVAVGAAFAFWSGRQPMAPAWMQRSGLEWLYRLSKEPRRLAGRYLILNPRFAGGVLRQKLSGTAATAELSEPPPLRYS